MSRPVNPVAAPAIFASDANYPAGTDPWSGQPLKVAVPNKATGFVPNQGAGAPHLNEVLNGITVNLEASRVQAQAQLDYLGNVPSLNFIPRVPLTYNTTMTASGWDNFYDRFYTSQTDGTSIPVLIHVDDHGQGQNSLKNVTLPLAASTDVVTDINTDTTGNAMVVTTSRYAWEVTGAVSSAAASRVDIIGAVVTQVSCQCVWIPSAAQWLFISLRNGAVQNSYHKSSFNRTAWVNTANVTGAALDANNGNNSANCFSMAVKNSTGRVVMVNRFNTTTLKVCTTDDLLATAVVARADITTAITSPTYVKLTYVTDQDAFYLVVAKTGTCEVWRSTDSGVTFTKMCTLASNSLRRIDGTGPLLLAQQGDASGGSFDLVASLDNGATWQTIGYRTSGTPGLGIFRTSWGFVTPVDAGGGAVTALHFSLKAGALGGRLLT